MNEDQVRYQKHTVIQGQAYVTRQDIVLTTLLGSCIAACICDREAGVGGMNHFLLPGESNNGLGSRSESYGAYLMELLINGLLTKGARRHALQAKVFGGARTMDLMSDIGSRNAEFALEFLQTEGIACVCVDVGGVRGRRIEYWPQTGRSRRLLMSEKVALANVSPSIPIRSPASLGEVEFF
ncbi:chemotaxis protein CheD [Fulvimarina sp. 2208YS6-2-32]|uniref:Probable chemoreceptor glutamine deamidase CheD n=1 Tax=Fulvimarina uroteuthidis TaxID=3098149 RepID=A0ABU5HXB7_9HYPH|nr:chemotaxis protein CheD [Fulvimarina sp. 2208YS6-2-32]MDY8107776.1 chemotaxis protein CheD [Fulvimarina sp. 2208YS6-2-32]